MSEHGLDPSNPELSRVATRGPLPAVVLTGGGARGAYQAGVLAGLAERFGDAPSPFRVITGASAGAINAAGLASARGSFRDATEALVAAWLGLSTEQVFESSFTSLGSSLARWAFTLATGRFRDERPLTGVLDTEPLRDYLSRYLDFDAMRENVLDERLWALALATTSYRTGETVTFIEGVPQLRTWRRARRRAERARLGVQHVMASAALPIAFPAIALDGDWYGDGSIRQSSPLAPALHLGADRVLAISVRHERTAAEGEDPKVPYPPPAQIIGSILNGVFLDALDDDAERLERINRTMALFPPDFRHPKGLRPVRLLLMRPSQDLGKLAAGLETELPRALRTLSGGLGTSRAPTPDLLSYLLFERAFIERLIELGRADARAEAARVESFLR